MKKTNNLPFEIRKKGTSNEELASQLVEKATKDYVDGKFSDVGTAAESTRTKFVVDSMFQNSNRKNSNYTLNSSNFVSDRTIGATTYTGWAAAVKYAGEKFIAAEVYMITEFLNVDVKCSIMDTSFNVITSTVKSVKQKGLTLFVFPKELDSTNIQQSVFYIAIEIVGGSSRLYVPNSNTAGTNYGGSATYKEYFTTTTNSTWTAAGAIGSYVVVSKFIKKEDLSFSIADSMEISLPDKIYGTINKEVNIYFDNIIKKDANDYLFDVTCTVGKQQNERWTAIPVAAGTFPLTIDIYDKNYNLVGSKTTNFIVKALNVGTGTKNLLFIGDSTIAGGQVVTEMKNLVNAVDDPTDLNLLGGAGTSPNFHEGRSGWTVSSFLTRSDSPFIFNSVFDFNQYMTTKGYASVDYICIHLGINDVLTGATNKLQAEIGNYETLVSSVKTFNPSVKIGIMITIPPSKMQDAFGESYTNGLTRWKYKYDLLTYVDALMSNFKNREGENIYLVPIHANLDTINNMSSSTAAANSRTTTTISRQNNSVHPMTEGYRQMADVAYYWLKSFDS